jgi:hypothetical protein
MKDVYIKELRQPYKEMALIEQEAQTGRRNDKETLLFAFNWDCGVCGNDFWNDVYGGNYPEITHEIKAKFPSVFKEEIEDKYKELDLFIILKGLELLKAEFEKDFDRENGFYFENKDAILRSPSRHNLLSVNRQIDIINEFINLKNK